MTYVICGLNYATIHHQPKYIHHHLAKDNICPYIYNLLLTLFLTVFFFFKNTIVLYMTEILRDKFLMSFFFRFKISATFCDIEVYISRL